MVVNRQVARGAIVLLALAANDARAQPKRRVERVLEAAQRELAGGRASQAERRLERELARGTTDARVLLHYAKLALPCSAEPEDGARARRAARRLLAAHARAAREPASQDVAAQRQLELEIAYALAHEGRFDESFSRVLGAGRRDDPETIACLRAIAVSALHAAREGEAARALELARNYAPTDLEVASDLGMVLVALGRAEDALAPLSERFFANPLALPARRDLAYALLASGRADEAFELLSRAGEPCTGAPGCLLELSRAALEAGELERAASCAEGVVDARPDDLDGWFALAEARTRAGKIDEARRAYEHVLALRPDSERAKQALRALAGSSADGVR